MRQNPNLRDATAVGFGAIAGALCRYYLGQWLAQTGGTDFPLGTFLINLSGCFLMGLVVTLATEKMSFPPEILLLLTTGFLGSYTTFSAYELDFSRLLSQPGFVLDAGYWLGSPLLGLLCFGSGVLLVQRLLPSKTRS